MVWRLSKKSYAERLHILILYSLEQRSKTEMRPNRDVQIAERKRENQQRTVLHTGSNAAQHAQSRSQVVQGMMPSELQKVLVQSACS